MTETPETPWRWLTANWDLMPEAHDDRVRWSYDIMDPWRLAYTPGVSPVEVEVGGEIVWRDGAPTRVDAVEIKAKAAEAAGRLFSRL